MVAPHVIRTVKVAHLSVVDRRKSLRVDEATQRRPEHTRRTAQLVHQLRLGQGFASGRQRSDDLGQLGAAGQAGRGLEECLG